jgi:YVTN family beta-propeller protein
MYRILLPFFLLCLACSEAPLIEQKVTARLNSPVSMVLIPGTNLAVVANANINLEETSGSLIAINLDTQEILKDTVFPIPSIAGRMYADGAIQRLYVASRSEDALLVYDYSVPGADGQEISFAAVDVDDPVKSEVPNGIKTDDNPFDVAFSSLSDLGDLLLVSNNLSGTVSVISGEDLEPIDQYEEDTELLGIPLVSSANFKNISKKPGRGASRMALTPDGKLLYVSSTQSSDIYVIDARDQKIEAMLDLSTLSAVPGSRGMAITTTGTAYVAMTGLEGVVALDVTGVVENGIPYEVADTKVLTVIPTGRGAECVLLTDDELHLFVSNENDNTVSFVDLATREVVATTLVGSLPSELVLDTPRGVVYVLNFLSDEISVLDLTTGALTGSIQ